MQFSEDKTLQLLCVKCIVSNFEELYPTLISVELFNVKVLQKLYSGYLLKSLAEQKRLKDKHLDFLLNKYTKEIHLEELVHCSFSKIKERLQDIGNVVEKFTMNNTRDAVKKFDDNIDHMLELLPSLQCLDACETSFSDHSLEILSENSSNLKCLILSRCKNVTDNGLVYLHLKQPPLEELNLYSTAVTSKGMATVLRSIPSLAKLGAENVPRAIFEAMEMNLLVSVYKGDVVQKFNLKNLKIFSGSKYAGNFTSILNMCVNTCPYVEDILVQDLQTEDQLKIISNFRNLKVVNIQMLYANTVCANQFITIRGQNLTSLSLQYPILSLKVISDYCPNLEILKLISPKFENIGHVEVSFPNLKSFRLQYLPFVHEETTRSVYSILNFSPNLREIFFSDTPVKACLIEDIIKKNPNLSQIFLSNTGITSSEYDDLMDIVDDTCSNVRIGWFEYTEAIRNSVYENTYYAEIVKP